MQTCQNEQVVGWIPDAVRPVLCPACGFGQTVAPTPRGDADRNSPFSRRSWPGSDLGVRAPDPDEIPLNEAEVAFGFEHGLI